MYSFLSLRHGKIARKLLVDHGWATKKMLHFKSALHGIFLHFYLTEKHQICILYKNTFIKKELH